MKTMKINVYEIDRNYKKKKRTKQRIEGTNRTEKTTLPGNVKSNVENEQ